MPGSLLLVISSPHVARGALYEANKRYFGSEHENILFWKATTSEMNPTFDITEIDRAFSEDPASARVEYDSEFRRESESYITSDAFDAVVQNDRQVLKPNSRFNYLAFLDSAGGSGTDSTAACIGHVEENDDSNVFVIDALIERRPPF